MTTLIKTVCLKPTCPKERTLLCQDCNQFVRFEKTQKIDKLIIKEEVKK